MSLPLLRAPTRSRWDAIVVGTGVGGCVTSALLAHAGLRVLVLEKNEVVGGILASYRKHGFKMDFGSHLLSRGERGPFGEVLRELGLSRPRFLRHRIPMRVRGLVEMAAPETGWGLPGAALTAARALHLPLREAPALLRLVVRVFAMREPELLEWDRRTLDEFIRQHTEHPATYFLFCFIASCFFVLPPWQVSAGESIRCLRQMLHDYSLSYVEGGMDSLAEALLSRVPACGGEIVVGARVQAIRRRGAELLVATDDGREHTAPAVACNLSPADLLGVADELEVPEPWAERARSIVPSGNAHQIKLGLKRPLVDEGCVVGGVSLNGLTVDDLSLELMYKSVASIQEGAVTDPMAVYAPVPTNFDPTLAPPGRQLIVGSIYGPVREDPRDSPELWKEHVLQSMEKMIPGLRDELLFCEFVPVPAVGRWMGKRSNAAICNAQVPGQVGRDRLPVNTPVPGLYLCGDGAGGRGVGTELAANSAREAAVAILHERARA